MSLHACRLGRERERESVCVCALVYVYIYTLNTWPYHTNMYVTIYTYYRYVIHKYFYCYMVSSSLWLLSGYTHIYISIDMLYIYYIYIYQSDSSIPQHLLSRYPSLHFPAWMARKALADMLLSSPKPQGGQRGIKKWGLNQQELALHQQKSGMKSTKWRLHQQPKWGLRNQFPCVAIDNKKVV